MPIREMKRLSGGLVFLTVLGVALSPGASPASAEDAESSSPMPKVKVFIFAGQSNMVGRSDPRLLPEEYRQPLPNVRLYANHAWRELAGPVRGRDGAGPEVSAARLLADAFPGQKIVIVKTAVGGTNLHTQWNPERKGSLYAQMLEDVKAATAGEDAEMEALFWAQGGADSKNEETAKAYGKNLAAFIARARKDLGRDDLPFIFSHRLESSPTPPNRKYPFLGEVAKGKTEVAKTVSHTSTVSTDGLTRKADGIHYDTAGTIEFGRRFFEAWEKGFHRVSEDKSKAKR